MKIIGISGTNGSGKDTVGQILGEKGWLFISVTDLLRAELKRQGLPLERENLRKVGNEWRREYGLGVLIDKAVEEYKRSGDHVGLAIASLRNPGEADRVHELGGKVVWVDADPKIRYQRIYSRGRSTEDSKTYEQFLAEEQAEMHHDGDAATLSMAGVKAKADIFINNNGSDIEGFGKQIKKQLGL